MTFRLFSVIPKGFEPLTHRLEICCSIQLSYGTIFLFLVQSRTLCLQVDFVQFLRICDLFSICLFSQYFSSSNSIPPTFPAYQHRGVLFKYFNDIFKPFYLIQNCLKLKNPQTCRFFSLLVGVAGFEPTTFCFQSRRDTGLRYTPRCLFYTIIRRI